jgi:hypothetical protein
MKFVNVSDLQNKTSEVLNNDYLALLDKENYKIRKEDDGIYRLLI